MKRIKKECTCSCHGYKGTQYDCSHCKATSPYESSPKPTKIEKINRNYIKTISFPLGEEDYVYQDRDLSGLRDKINELVDAVNKLLSH